jgi:hypothetical protein
LFGDEAMIDAVLFDIVLLKEFPMTVTTFPKMVENEELAIVVTPELN